MQVNRVSMYVNSGDPLFSSHGCQHGLHQCHEAQRGARQASARSAVAERPSLLPCLLLELYTNMVRPASVREGMQRPAVGVGVGISSAACQGVPPVTWRRRRARGRSWRRAWRRGRGRGTVARAVAAREEETMAAAASAGARRAATPEAHGDNRRVSQREMAGSVAPGPGRAGGGVVMRRGRPGRAGRGWSSLVFAGRSGSGLSRR